MSIPSLLKKVFVTKDFREKRIICKCIKALKFEVEGKSLIEIKTY